MFSVEIKAERYVMKYRVTTPTSSAERDARMRGPLSPRTWTVKGPASQSRLVRLKPKALFHAPCFFTIAEDEEVISVCS